MFHWAVLDGLVFDGLCGRTHRSHGLRAFCFYINLVFSGVFAFSLPTHLTPPTLLTLITMSSPSASAPSPSSENLTNVKGLSSWELLQNHYQRIGSVHKYDYFSSVSFPLLLFFASDCFVSFSLVFFLGRWVRRCASGSFFC